MRKVYRWAGIIAIVILLVSCKKGEIASPNLNGTYRGEFSVRDNPLANNTLESSDSVIVTFKGSSYQSTANLNHMPAGGQGSYATQYDEITFRDTTVHTTDFDQNQVLNGTYNYSTKGDSLLIVKQVNYVFYTYKLKRQ